MQHGFNDSFYSKKVAFKVNFNFFNIFPRQIIFVKKTYHIQCNKSQSIYIKLWNVLKYSSIICYVQNPAYNAPAALHGSHRPGKLGIWVGLGF